MTDHEPTIHCPPNSKPHLEADIHLEKLWVTQSTLDGLNALVHWLQGFEAGGNHGRVPGHFDLVMHLRSMRSARRVAPTEIETIKEDGNASEPAEESSNQD